MCVNKFISNGMQITNTYIHDKSVYRYSEFYLHCFVKDENILEYAQVIQDNEKDEPTFFIIGFSKEDGYENLITFSLDYLFNKDVCKEIENAMMEMSKEAYGH